METLYAHAQWFLWWADGRRPGLDEPPPFAEPDGIRARLDALGLTTGDNLPHPARGLLGRIFEFINGKFHKEER